MLMHPELPAQMLQYADVVGSTADILKYALEHEEDCIIGTERSVRDYLALMRPAAELLSAVQTIDLCRYADDDADRCIPCHAGRMRGAYRASAGNSAAGKACH